MSAALKLNRDGSHTIDASKIPAEMRGLDRWVVWRLMERAKGKTTKVPFQAGRPGDLASSTDRATWSPFDAAMAAYSNPTNKLDGIGFVFAEEGPFAGVDFDACLADDGTILEWAAPYLGRLVGYAEVSPSGRGVKAIIRGEVPGGKGRKKQRLGPDKAGAIEIYDRGRFFTITSRRLDDGHTDVGDGGSELERLHAELFPPVRKGRKPAAASSRPLKSDSGIIEKAQRAANGAKFAALWGGSIEGHPSKSEADLALCSMLAWWTGGDVDSIDRLFRQSGLHDAKWDRISYREPTIDRACNQSSYHDPSYRRPSVGPKLHDPDSTSLATLPPDPARAEPEDGGLPTFGNYHPVEKFENGRIKIKPVAHPLHQIEADRNALVPGWPKRVGKQLFAESKEGTPRYLETPAQLFAWLGRSSHVDWTKGARFVTQEQFFAHLQEDAEAFDRIETMPHVPPMRGAYYMHREMPEPTGRLDELIDQFLPDSPLDRSLILALVMTPLWGGLPGTRPAFLVTGPDFDPGQGRGIGKSTLVDLIADELYLGPIDVTSKDDMDAVKTRILSKDGQAKRIGRLDNVKSHRFSWADLEGIITATKISGRALYQGNGTRTNDMTWMITLNGASLSKDMAERVITIRLKRPPKNRDGAWREKVVRFIQDHRWSIYADIAAILDREPGPMRPASRWAAWEQAVLSKLPLAEERQAAIASRRDESDEGNADQDMIRDAVAQAIRNNGREPDDSVIKIPAGKMAEIVSHATRRHYETASATNFVKGLSIGELVHDRDKRGRFWIWTGCMVGSEREPEPLELSMPPR